MASRKRTATEDLAERPNALIRRVGTGSEPRGDSPNSQRAARCLQHIRALNSQFASWINDQLQRQPDTLWKAGVCDYVKHATAVMEDFKDVYDWVKNNPTPPTVSAPSPLPPTSLPCLQAPSTMIVPAFTAGTTTTTTIATSALGGGATFLTPSAPSPAFGKASSSSAPTTNHLPQTSSAAPSFPSFAMSSPAFSASAAAAATSAKGGGGLLFTGLTGVASSAPPPSSKQEAGAVVVAGGEKKPWVPSTSFMPPPLTAGFGSGLGGTTGWVMQPLGVAPFTGAGFGIASTLPALKTTPLSEDRGEDGNTANQNDEDEEPPQPESPSVKGTVEEGVQIEHSVVSKLYIKGEGGWKDMGKGELSVRRKQDAERGTKEAQARILLRTDGGKLLLNANLYKGMSVTVNGAKVLVMLISAVQPPIQVKAQDNTNGEKKEGDGAEPNGGGADPEGPKMQMYLLKVGTADKAKELSKVMLENAPNKE